MKFLNSTQDQLVSAIVAINGGNIDEKMGVDDLFNDLQSTLTLQERDFLKIFHLFFALADTPDRISRIVSVLSTPSTKAPHQLQLLVYLYNLTRNNEMIISIFKAAESFNLINQLEPSFDSILVSFDSLPSAHQSFISSLLANYNASRYGWLYLKYDGTTQVYSIVAEMLKHTEFMAVFDVVDYPTIVAVPNLHNLLISLKNGDFSTVASFQISELPIDIKDLVTKAKIVALTQLGLRNIGKHVAYETIAKDIEITVDQVEKFVIEAVRSNVIEVKMDQVGKNILIYHAYRLNVTSPDWKVLQTRLHELKDELCAH